MGDKLVRWRVLEAVREELAGVKRHAEALDTFMKYKISSSSQALSLLGYKVRWSGLDPESVEIFKV